jgi:hypothetical protein
MATVNPSKPSFSPARKWGAGLHVFFIIFLVLSVVVMVNYLSHDYYTRFYLSTRTRNELSLRTLKLLESITNNVRVTIYYDRNDSMFSTIADLLEEYHRANPKVYVRSIDYLRDAAGALQLKAKYNFLNAATAKNLVIFDCDGKVKPVDGNALSQYVMEEVPSAEKPEYRKKPTAFLGESLFTAALLDVTNPKPMMAYFLRGHGEHLIDSGDQNVGYLKFATVLQQNYIQVQSLTLLGTNQVPMDCNLLVIGGPTGPIPEFELEKIDQYLNQGGRLLALLNYATAGKPTGLEAILRKWGVMVGPGVVRDPENSATGYDVVVSIFGKHPVVNPLLEERLHLQMPRPVGAAEAKPGSAEEFKAVNLAFTGPKAYMTGTEKQVVTTYPVIAAVEKGAIKGVITERGTTRMLIVGDSIFLANRQIESAANRDFAGYAANWLLDRTQLLEGVGPRQVNEYKLVMSKSQLQRAQWLLLGGMPGAALLLGSLVWLRRRR